MGNLKSYWTNWVKYNTNGFVWKNMCKPRVSLKEDITSPIEYFENTNIKIGVRDLMEYKHSWKFLLRTYIKNH